MDIYVYSLNTLESLEVLTTHATDARGVFFLQQLHTAISKNPQILDVDNARERILALGKKHLVQEISYEGSGHVSDLTLENIRDPENPIGKWLRKSWNSDCDEVEVFMYELAISYLMLLLLLL